MNSAPAHSAAPPVSAPLAASLAAAVSVDSIVLDYGLMAQSRLSPYVMGYFGIGLPIFLWAMSVSLSPWWLALYLPLFVVAWTVFMVLKGQSERLQAVAQDQHNGDRKANIKARLYRHAIAGAVWTATLFVISLTAGRAGVNPEMLLMICAGAAVGIIFFSSPVLIYLLILGPLAVAGPIIALHGLGQSPELSRLMTGGLALALAMGFVLNRHMREHYLLQHRQSEIAAEREAARAASEALNDAKIALMETLSREVQTGLKGVEQSLSQCLTVLTRAPAPRQYVDAALSEIAHLQTILVTTLDNDTAEAGQIELDIRPLDIELLCQKVIAQFAGLAHGKELSLSLTAQGSPTQGLPDKGLPAMGAVMGAVMGDEHRVEQILAHLVGNAVLYTQQGRVELKLIMVPDGFMRLEVVDSGPGLSAEELEQAFQPHARVARTSAGHSGAGLGLSLSKSLSELMGGSTGAQSTPDVGSKFWLDLPFDTTATAPARAVEVEEVEWVSDHSLRILLLSNDSLRSAQLRDSLEKLGHKCLTSTSRERALALAKKAPVDACLISTGAFEDLDDQDNRRKLDQFLGNLRATQAEARLNILALLPAGEQAEDLQALGVQPLLLPQSRESLGRALAQF